jgi:GNAT superfamily N-acetyltransferase
MPQSTPSASPTSPPSGPAGYSIDMVREHLRAIPQYAPPAGYTFRPMQPTDGAVWVDIWRDAEPYFQIADDTFAQSFGADPALIAQRCFLLLDPTGAAAGTISAWFDATYRGREYGRIHWVAMRRAYQGSGLGKVLMTYAMNRLAHWHDCAVLNTQSKRLGAIKLYLEFGFAPNLDLPGTPAVWAEILGERHLGGAEGVRWPRPMR